MKTIYAYVGERILFRVPAHICTQYGWKKYSRFSILTDPDTKKITLLEAGEEHEHEEIVFGDTLQISISARICEATGWEYGDVISVDFKGREIVLQKVKR
ncbi:hypothetical protein FXV91_18130 [Methanosarcina sp. DH2]|jgi:hypothetical protein|uniref:hypothetical protein n=1 Tax=Methanosarcina sp. DH2 TaxID=2605639 RepID=UPI001E327AC8|nr:hypothetical protein [Methanosarcina sp. DH2]MCC4772010.1 hypothetical protein [Methanosarcina sp. DH2]